MEILAVSKLVGRVVFVSGQELALEHVVDGFDGQVERETTFFTQAMVHAAEVVHHVEGNDRCYVQGTLGMLDKISLALHRITVQAMVFLLDLPLSSKEEDHSFEEYNGVKVHVPSALQTCQCVHREMMLPTDAPMSA